MGLAVSVDIISQVYGDEEGIDYYRSQFDELSAELAADGVTWTEPDGLRRRRGGRCCSASPTARCTTSAGCTRCT
ncbi:hypothetical protein GCM10029964_006820 [Kibdelosporangium lantanae]